MTAEEFAKNFYIEKQNLVEQSFDFKRERRSYVSVKIEELNLDKQQNEKLKHIVSALLNDAFYTVLLGLDGSASIGDKQEDFKIYDNQNNLISNCGELEVEAYEYFHNHKFETEK